MEIGTATSEPGTVATGWLPVAELPTGGEERLPVVITEGEREGPTLWVTGALHGDEVTGMAVAQDVATEALAAELNGTLVTVPIVNPAGVRTDRRTSYYHGDDPNRCFPYGAEGHVGPPRVQECIAARLFAALTRTADALVSLHEGWINEGIYTIVERVRYGRDRSREEAEALAERTVALAEAFGIPVVREYDVAAQEAEGLERSLECAAVNAAGIPTITPELGSPHVVEDRYRRYAVSGVRNVMHALDMLDGAPSRPEAPAAPVEYPVKRVDGPVAPVAGLVRHHVDVGQVVAPGDPLADVVTPHGEVRATVTCHDEGYILGRRHGVAVYENDVVVAMAARDDGDLVVQRR